MHLLEVVKNIEFGPNKTVVHHANHTLAIDQEGAEGMIHHPRRCGLGDGADETAELFAHGQVVGMPYRFEIGSRTG